MKKPLPISGNSQKPEGRADHDGSYLDVKEVFPTIQGEGPYCGKPAVFVRLAGCNLQCPACDTDYTSYRRKIPVQELAAYVSRNNTQYPNKGLVVITGGEPFRQPLGMFIAVLLQEGYLVQVETNGVVWDPTMGLTTHDVCIVCSPKTPHVHPQLVPHIDALKYVLTAGEVDENDGLPTKSLNMGQRPWRKGVISGHVCTAEVYVQPCWANTVQERSANLEAAIASCCRFGYRLSIQTHKLIGLP